METEKYFVLCLVFFIVSFFFSLFVSSLQGLFEKQDPWVMLRIIGYNALIFLIIPALCYLFYKHAL